MKGNVPVAAATQQEAVLAERVQGALGQFVGAAKEGLLALSVGLGVLEELMAEGSTMSSVRRGAGTRTAPPSGTVTRPAG